MKRKLAGQFLSGLGLFCMLSTQVLASEVDNFCKRISLKLASVSYEECRATNYQIYSTRTVDNAPLIMKEFKPAANTRPLKVLFFGGVHGDEYSSVSATFKWLNTLEKNHSGKFHWLFFPMMNPDGMLRQSSRRTNARGVDLNRNFPPFGKAYASLEYWNRVTSKDPRRFPGKVPASEPETKAMMKIIDEFKPDVIVSVHAPYDLLDFDGAKDSDAPQKLGPLALQKLGTYPGSLGNYAWLKLKIPVVTLELPNADVMPAKPDLDGIWRDLVAWLGNSQPGTRLAATTIGLRRNLE